MSLGRVRLRRCVSLIALLFLSATVTRADEEKPVERVRMPLNYKQAMVVVVSAQGAAGLRFVEPFELGNETGNGIIGASYEWRYLERKPNAAEQTGTGRVFAKLVNGAVDHGSSTLTCGPMQLTWSPTDNGSGVIQYAPQVVAVHPVSAEYFSGNETQQVKAVDLSRFLETSDEANRQNSFTAGPALYVNCVLVVKDPSGIATFKFGHPFEKPISQGEKRFGVPYDFTFQSLDGQSQQSGQDEVYERYTNNQYDHGRLDLEAGPVHLTWSQGGKESGWVYYDPSWKRVWYVDAADADSLVRALAAGDPLRDTNRP